MSIQNLEGSRGIQDREIQDTHDFPGLYSVANHPREWMRRVQGTENCYYRAIGSAEALMLKAADLGQCWTKGVSGEYALKKLREQPVPW